MCQTCDNLGVASRVFSYDTLYAEEVSEVFEYNDMLLSIAV
jgi:hypothetical protein